MRIPAGFRDCFGESAQWSSTWHAYVASRGFQSKSSRAVHRLHATTYRDRPCNRVWLCSFRERLYRGIFRAWPTLDRQRAHLLRAAAFVKHRSVRAQRDFVETLQYWFTVDGVLCSLACQQRDESWFLQAALCPRCYRQVYSGGVATQGTDTVCLLVCMWCMLNSSSS